MGQEASILGLTIDRGLSVPSHTQIKEAIRREIATGCLRPGDRLPGFRQIGRSAGVSSFTVARAVADLARQGLVVTHSGSGTYVSSRKPPSFEVIVPYQSGGTCPDDEVKQRFFDCLLEGLCAAAPQERRAFLTYLDPRHTRAEEILAVAEARQITGLVVYQPRGPIANEMSRVAEAIPTVALKCPLPGDAADCVKVDFRPGLGRALEGYLRAGKRRLGLVGGRRFVESRVSPYGALHEAFLSLMEEPGVSPDVALMDDDNPGTGLDDATLRRLRACAVIVAITPDWAEAMARACPDSELITFTEHRDTREHLRRKNAVVLYAGLEAYAAKAAELLTARADGRLAGSGQRVFIEAEVFEPGPA